ncbi:MAG: hypothetical protein QOE06_1372, partial [Thermoleophilaceae bacterium]|nr:hypothetical protein [Thermoleophilaceae bacterium]
PNNMPSGGAGGNATSGQGGAAGHGGVTTQGTVTITNATITANDASAPGSGASANGGPGGAGSGGASGSTGVATTGTGGDPAGEGVRAGGPLTISNSIVAGNPKGNCSGGPADGGHNVTFGTGPCPGTVADPKLGALADNGGATATHRPGPGSAALDIVPGSGSNCPTTDQRGAARPRGPGCEAGAVEIAPPVALTGAASGVSTAAATLGGTVNAVGLPGTFHFDYGTTGAYGTSTLDGTLAAGTGATPASAPITGLAADTQYHFRVVVTTIDGTALGDDHTFRTAAVDTGNPQDTVAPVLSAVSLTNKIFAVNPKGAAEISAAKAKAKKPKLGTALRFTLSEAARVVFTIQRASVGRTVGTSCVKATKANAKKKHCRLLTPAGRFAANAVAGANTKTFSGRIGKRSLTPGSYRFVLVATDAAGNASKPVTATFRVVKK